LQVQHFQGNFQEICLENV